MGKPMQSRGSHRALGAGEVLPSRGKLADPGLAPHGSSSPNRSTDLTHSRPAPLRFGTRKTRRARSSQQQRPSSARNKPFPAFARRLSSSAS
jgi:hypothetical protein